MVMNIAKARLALVRGLRLRCPRCGRGSVFRMVFRMRDHCTDCGLVFHREQGYFVGAIYLNVIATEALILAVFIFSFFISGIFSDSVFIVFYVISVVFPLVFYHHSRSLWLAFDHFLDPSSSEGNNDVEPRLAR